MRVAVSGASRGLGLAVCQELIAQGHEVVALCRGSTPALVESGAMVVEGIDVAEENAFEAVRGALGEAPVDALVSNAAINCTFDQDIADLNLAPLAAEYRVNVVGAIRMVQALLPSMRAGSKIALVSGGALMIAVVIVNPGPMDTDLHRTVIASGRGDPAPGAAPAEVAVDLIARIEELGLDTSGSLLDRSGEALT
jgi:nucleoside-diphosphate-sugar epimerase